MKMKIKITSVVSEETLVPLNNFYTRLEDALNDCFEKKPYGPLDLFSFTIVSVYDADDENEKIAKGHNKSGRFTDPFTKEKVKYFSIAVPYNVNKVLSLSDTELRRDLCAVMIHGLENTSVKIPKGFDFDGFSNDVKLALEIYKRAETQEAVE